MFKNISRRTFCLYTLCQRLNWIPENLCACFNDYNSVKRCIIIALNQLMTIRRFRAGHIYDQSTVNLSVFIQNPGNRFNSLFGPCTSYRLMISKRPPQSLTIEFPDRRHRVSLIVYHISAYVA